MRQAPPEKVRILEVSDDYWPNLDGGALFERRLALALSEEHEVRVWAPSPTGKRQMQSDSEVLILRVPSRVLAVNPRYRVARLRPWLLWRDFHRWNPAVVHVHNAGVLGLLALTFARIRRRPVLGTNHMTSEQVSITLGQSRWAGLAVTWFTRYLAWFHNRCQRLTAPSRYALAELRGMGITTEASIVSNGVDAGYFTPATKTDGPPAPNPLSLIYVGRIDEDKAVDELIDWLGAAARQRALRVTIVGTGKSAAAVRTRAEQLQADPERQITFVFPGVVPEETKRTLLRQAQAFCITARHELQCIAALEAMACGLPLVAPRAGALPELCRPGVSGWLFDPADQADFVRQIVAISSPEAAVRGLAARALVLREHDHPRTAGKYSAILRALAEPAS